MARVMVYPLHNTTAWWRHVAKNLTFATDTTVVSDLKDADICITPAFYKTMNDARAGQLALDAFGSEGCAEIIARCRFLRVFDPDMAHRMIGAMWRAIDEAVERYAPDVLLSCVVDRYSLDIFERVLRKRGVRYVGLAISPVPDQIMFMAKGEYLPVCEPSDQEIEDAIATLTPPHFLPSYVGTQSFGLKRFARLYGYFTLRWLTFEVLQLWERNPFEHRYRSTRDPASGFRIRLRDWEVVRQVNPRWRERFDATPRERRIFLGLQVVPEAAIDQWVQDLGLIRHEEVFERAATVLTAAGYQVFVKDHPSQFGFRQIEHVRRLTAIPGVTFVPYEVPGRTLTDNCHATLTLTGTVGLQAALSGRGAIVSSDTYYAFPGRFILLNTREDIETLPQALRAFTPPADLHQDRRMVVRHLLRSSVPGTLNWLKWSPASDPDNKVDGTIQSLNQYGPQLLPDGRFGYCGREAAPPIDPICCV